jgi:hypothetical protein
MLDIIINEVQTFLNKRKYNLRISEHCRLSTLFKNSLNENSDKRNEVISLIKNNQWENQNPNHFIIH